MPNRKHPVATIGYQGTTMDHFLAALKGEKVDLLVDVRAVASSRRAGFSKTALAANLNEAGIEYLHLRGLGTPADGRAAARSGKHAEMQRIFGAHLATWDAQEALHRLEELVRAGRHVCLLCFEADPAHCHRTLVARALAERVPVTVTDLRPDEA